MSQQIDNDNVEHDGPVIETQNLTQTSKNNARQTESEPVLEAEVVKERSFSERWKTSRFWLVRGSYYILFSVWMVVMAIGGLIAWLIALLFI